jgi:hypothetical protein
VTTCYLSNYFEVDRLKTKTCKEIIRILKSHFSRWGTPSILCSDNSPFNSAEFVKFARDWGFQQVFSSPTYAQSNGKIEKSVQTIKKLMQKAVDDNLDIHKVILEFRNTPSESSNLAPIEVMLNRQTRSVLPVANSKLSSNFQEDAKQALIQSKHKQAFYYNRTARVRPSFSVGDNVRIKDRPNDKHWRAGVVTDCLPHRSYNVQLSDNSNRRRTSRHIKWSPLPPLIIDEHDTDYSREPDIEPSQTPHRPSNQDVNHKLRCLPSPMQPPSCSSNETTGITPSTPNSSNSPNSASSHQVVDASAPTSPRPILKKQPAAHRVESSKSNSAVIHTRSGRLVKRPQRYCE